MSVAEDRTFGEQIESTPKTILFFFFGFSILLVGFLLDAVGMPYSAGLAGALSVVLMALALLVHVIYFVLGRLD